MSESDFEIIRQVHALFADAPVVTPHRIGCSCRTHARIHFQPLGQLFLNPPSRPQPVTVPPDLSAAFDFEAAR